MMSDREDYFLLAASSGDLETLDRYVESVMWWTRWEALKFAAHNGHLNIVGRLLQQPDLDIGSFFYLERDPCYPKHPKSTASPLHLAVKEGHLEIVEQIIGFLGERKEELKPNWQTTEWADELVELAVRHRHTEILEFLVRDPLIEIGRLPLHLALAACKGHSHTLKVLVVLCKESEPLVSTDGLTPLHLAAQSGCTSAVLQLLVDRGKMNVNVRSHPELFTPLHMAANSGQAQVVKFLLQSLKLDFLEPWTIDPMARDCMGRTALHYAAREGHASVVQHFVDCPSVNPELTDLDGLTPLHMAAKGGHVKVISILSSHGVNKRAKHLVHLKRIFTLAFEKGRFYSCVEGGIRFPRPKLIDSLFWRTGGFTPLHFAARYGHKEAIRELLKESKVDLLADDCTGFRAYDWAEVQNQEKMFLHYVKLDETLKLNMDSLLVSTPEMSIAGMKSWSLKVARRDLSEEKQAIEKLQHPWESPHPITTISRSQWIMDEGWGGMQSNGPQLCLHWAASRGEMSWVKKLLAEEDIDVNEKDEQGFTALNLALRQSNFEVATELLLHPKIVLNECVDDNILNLDDWVRTKMKHVNVKDRERKRCLEKFLVVLLTRHNVEDAALLKALLPLAKGKGLDPVVRVILERPELKRRLYEDRQVYLDCANATLVGAALIAGVAYQGWLQPPLGYNFRYDDVDYASLERHEAVRYFWWFNSFAFFLSIATVIAGATGAMPVVEDTNILMSVEKTKRAVEVATVLLGMAVVCVMAAFAAAGFAVLPPLPHELHVMHISVGCGATACGLALLWFCTRLWPLLSEGFQSHLPLLFQTIHDTLLMPTQSRRAVEREIARLEAIIYCRACRLIIFGYLLALLTRGLQALGLRSSYLDECLETLFYKAAHCMLRSKTLSRLPQDVL